MVELIRPKFLVLENVTGFMSGFTKVAADGELSRTIAPSDGLTRDLKQRGYHVSSALINCAEWGVPQRRLRFIAIAVRDDVFAANEVVDSIQILKGFALATKDVAMYKERFKKLRDGLVDVTFVSVKRTEGEKLVRAIPMECRGERCAAMTADGPISLPKDSFGEESIARVELTDACYTEAGLAKRRATVSAAH
jgi:site-specific DNA-cytosine methylase